MTLLSRLCFVTPLLLLCSLHTGAQGTRQWTSSRLEEFERGTAKNVGLRNDGRIEAAPALSTLGVTEMNYVWSVAASGDGAVYAGTGALTGGSQLIRIDARGTVTTVGSFREANVQALEVLADGSIVLATSPDGKVYCIQNGGKPQVIFDAAQVGEKPKYLWSLAQEKNGSVLVATGAPAAIYRIHPKEPAAKAELVFKSGDQHIRCLLIATDGTIFAGSDGAGVLYRLTPAGKAFALFAAPRHEISAIALDPQGNVYAAAVGEKRPAASLAAPLPTVPTASAGLGPAAPAASAPISLAGTGTAPVADGSAIYRIAPDGTPQQLLTLREDVAYALAFRKGALYAGTGNKGRVYRLDPALPGSYTDVAHADARETTALRDTAQGLLIGTGGTGKVLRLEDEPAKDAVFTSEMFDGEVASQWGRAELTGSREGVELYARSGNVENPRDGLGDLWSEWKPVPRDASPLPVPAARYMQWRAALHGGATLASVTINYLPRNLPPQVDDIVVQTGARLTTAPAAPPSNTVAVTFRPALPAATAAVSATDTVAPVLLAQRDRTAITARWLAHDPNNDDLMFALYFRDVHEQNWHLIKDKISERAYSFDTGLLPDGEYELRVVASDAPVHTDADTLMNERISPPFTVDTTPPVPGPLRADVRSGVVHAAIEVHDATSPIVRAEFSVDAGPWQYLEPVGRLSDSLTERYDLTQRLTGSGQHTVALRFFDRYENGASVKAIVQETH